MYNHKNYSMQEGRDWCYQSSALCDNDVWHPNPESWLFHALLIGIKIGLFSKYRVGNEQTDICTDTLKTLCLRLPASPGTNKYKNDRTHATYKQGCESISYALQCGILLRRENPTCSYWVPVAAAIRGFNMALFTASRGNNFVRCTCASPSALLVTSLLMCSIFFT